MPTTLLYTGLLVSSLPAIADTGPAEFVCTRGSEALDVIRADTPPAQTDKLFHHLLQQDFGIPGMAQLVLGPYLRVASEPERRESLEPQD
jgi:ABC-type transporter MlaC component